MAIRDGLEEGDQIGVGVELNGGSRVLGHHEWAGPGSKPALSDGAKGGPDILSGGPRSLREPIQHGVVSGGSGSCYWVRGGGKPPGSQAGTHTAIGSILLHQVRCDVRRKRMSMIVLKSRG